jgi:hypothetical protein
MVEDVNSYRQSRHRARWYMGLAYFAVSAIAAGLLARYLEKVGGVGGIPNAMYLAFGPFIALAQGHGLFIYIAATVSVLPLLVVATGRSGAPRAALIAVAIGIWLVIGRWMYAG